MAPRAPKGSQALDMLVRAIMRCVTIGATSGYLGQRVTHHRGCPKHPAGPARTVSVNTSCTLSARVVKRAKMFHSLTLPSAGASPKVAFLTWASLLMESSGPFNFHDSFRWPNGHGTNFLPCLCKLPPLKCVHLAQCWLVEQGSMLVSSHTPQEQGKRFHMDQHRSRASKQATFPDKWSKMNHKNKNTRFVCCVCCYRHHFSKRSSDFPGPCQPGWIAGQSHLDPICRRQPPVGRAGWPTPLMTGNHKLQTSTNNPTSFGQAPKR